ncbi:MAG: tyrosine-type recombinase/integrase [Promethearchaeota archaeon]
MVGEEEMIFAEIKAYFAPVAEKNANFLCKYFTKLESQSDNSVMNVRSSVSLFYKMVNKSILDTSVDDAEHFVAWLDTKYALSSLKSHVKRVKAFYRFCLKIEAKNGNIIPDVWDYVDLPAKAKESTEEGYDVEWDDLENESKALDGDSIARIMKCANAWSFRLFVLLAILKHTGMRVSEAITIRVKNINFEKRIIVSGLVKGYSKVGKVIHPFPIFLVVPIKKLIAINRGNEWLFEGRGGKSHYKNPQGMIKTFRIKNGLDFTYHQFRHSIVSRRTKNGCPREFNKFLTNHAVSGLEERVYDFPNWKLEDRTKKFDEWHPYNGL